MADSHITTSSYATQERLIPDQQCAFCDSPVDVYQMGGKWICKDHVAFTVSLAANDIWPTLVSYKHEFEKVLL